MACQKVCKQGRDDIIVKVNLQSPIPTSFYIAVTNQFHSHKATSLHRFDINVKAMQGCGFVNLPSLLYHPYLVCTLFGMPSLHPFTFLMFLSLV